MSNVLDKILAHKHIEVQAMIADNDQVVIAEKAARTPSLGNLVDAIRSCDGVPIIAEVKRASPSMGVLRNGLDVRSLAEQYERGMASAISVLTDTNFFSGSYQDLADVRDTVDIPVLCKDFIIDPIQLYMARASGADAVLLIVSALDATTLADLYELALDLGMTPLLEIHKEDELKPVLALNPQIVGINNRDLGTMKVSLETCIKLRKLVPSDILVVAESGISSPDDIFRLRSHGLDAFLVGTSLVLSDDPTSAVISLYNAEVA